MPQSRRELPTMLPYLRSVEQAIGMRVLFPLEEYRSQKVSFPEPTSEAHAATHAVYAGGLALIGSVRQQFNVPGRDPFTPTQEQREWLAQEQDQAVNELQAILRAHGPIINTRHLPYATMLRPLYLSLVRHYGFGRESGRIQRIVNAVGPTFFTFRSKPEVVKGELYLDREDAARIRTVATAINPRMPGSSPAFHDRLAELVAETAPPTLSLATLAMHTRSPEEALGSELLRDGIHGYHYPDEHGVNQVTYRVSDLPWYVTQKLPPAPLNS